MTSKRTQLTASDDDSVAPSKELLAWMDLMREQVLKSVPECTLMIALHSARCFLKIAREEFGDDMLQPDAGQWGLLLEAEQLIVKVIKERNEIKPDRN